MARITLDVDGKPHTIDADPDMPLLYALRNDIGLNNPHFGCGVAVVLRSRSTSRGRRSRDMNRDDDVRFISRDRVPREAAVGGRRTPATARALSLVIRLRGLRVLRGLIVFV